MKTILVAAASAIFCAAVITELTTRLWPGNYLALLLTATILLFLSGLLNLRLASVGNVSASGRGNSRGPTRDASAGDSRTSRRSRSSQQAETGTKRAAEQRSSRSAPEATGPREEGTVKWFNRNKGFGFVIRQSGEEIFVHQRSIRAEDSDGRRRPNLRDGQKVSFSVSDREKGLQADDVVPLEDD